MNANLIPLITLIGLALSALPAAAWISIVNNTSFSIIMRDIRQYCHAFIF